jgi:lysophospholipase L1-like esterase
VRRTFDIDDAGGFHLNPGEYAGVVAIDPPARYGLDGQTGAGFKVAKNSFSDVITDPEDYEGSIVTVAIRITTETEPRLPPTADDLVALSARVDALANTSTVITALGDSMTRGYGVPSDQSYPAQLATRIGAPVVNRGVSSQKIGDIFSRWGSERISVTLPGNTIPASGAVDFTIPRTDFNVANPIIDANAADSFTGTIEGVAGTLSYLGPSSFRFTRATPGQAKRIWPSATFVMDLEEGRYEGIAIFWAGRNSLGLQETTGATFQQQFDATFAAYERGIAKLKGRRFLVMGPANRNDEYPGSTATASGAVLNGSQSYDLIIAIEREMQARWPAEYVAQRRAVVASYDPSNPADVADYAADRTPTSLRIDFLHYSAAGNTVVAAALDARGRQLGYWGGEA